MGAPGEQRKTSVQPPLKDRGKHPLGSTLFAADVLPFHASTIPGPPEEEFLFLLFRMPIPLLH